MLRLARSALVALAFLVHPGGAEAQPAGPGKVTVTVVNGGLTVKGAKKRSVGITIDQDGLTPDQFRITPDGGTLVNGSADPVVVAGVTGDAVIDLGKKADAVTIRDAAFPGSLKVKTKGGDDAVEMTDVSVAGSLLVKTGAGSDAVKLIGVTSGLDTRILAGAGDDALEVLPGRGAPAASRLAVAGGTGSLTADLVGLQLISDLFVEGGTKSDTISIEQLATGNVVLLLKTGDNVATCTDSELTGSFLVIGAPKGDDTVGLSQVSIGAALELFLLGGSNDVQLSGTTVDAGVFYNQNASANQRDELAFSDVTITGPTRIELGKGQNDFAVGGTSQLEDLELSAKGGNDTISLLGVTFEALVRLQLKGGQNVAILNGSTFASDLQITAGAGDDFVDLTDAVVQGTTQIDLGGGANTLLP